jgi:hypothetical protein
VRNKWVWNNNSNSGRLQFPKAPSQGQHLTDRRPFLPPSAPPPPADNSTSAALGSKGREEVALRGVAAFDALQLKGAINSTYQLQV